MRMESCVQDGKTVAVITGTQLVPTGAQSALDLIMTRAMRRCVRMRYLCIEKSLCRPAEAFSVSCAAYLSR